MNFDRKYTTLYSLIFLNASISVVSPLLIPLLLLVTFGVFAAIDLKLTYSRYKRPSFEIRSLEKHMIRRLILVPKLISFWMMNLVFQGIRPETWFEKIFAYFLIVLFFTNFDFILNQFEKFVERRCMGSPGRREKFYSENSSGFGSDYESEYLGVKRSHKVDSSMSAEVSENFGENPM